VKARHWYIAAAVLWAVVAGAVYFLRVPEVDCAKQQPSALTPKCLATTEQHAAAGDTIAMLKLVQYFEPRDRNAAQQWVRKAAQRGEPSSVQRIFAECGEGKAFSVQDAEALLANVNPLDEAYFRLGGSCKPADMAFAAQLAPSEFESAGDVAGLCRVAVKYAQLSVSPAGAGLDPAKPVQLLAACERRAAPGSEALKEAQLARQLLQRQIRAVRLE